jgi:hypothetical protein
MIKLFKHILLIFELFVVFIATFIVISYLIFSLFAQSCKKEVKGNARDGFPILVVTPSKTNKDVEGHIIYIGDFNDFQQNNPQYSFYVPEGQAEKFNQEIIRKYPWDAGASFKIKQLSETRQLLKVRYDGDDDFVNIGLYETDGNEIFPKYHTFYFGPGVAMVSLPVAFLANIIVWIVGLVLYVGYRKRRLVVKSIQ